MSHVNERLLASYGWTVECESPFEIRNQDGSFATGQAADSILSSLLEESVVMKFKELALGAKFKYLEQDQVWIKISDADCGLIAEYDDIYISHRNWTGQKVCSFADNPEDLNVLDVLLVE